MGKIRKVKAWMMMRRSVPVKIIGDPNLFVSLKKNGLCPDLNNDEEMIQVEIRWKEEKRR